MSWRVPQIAGYQPFRLDTIAVWKVFAAAAEVSNVGCWEKKYWLGTLGLLAQVGTVVVADLY